MSLINIIGVIKPIASLGSITKERKGVSKKPEPIPKPVLIRPAHNEATSIIKYNKKTPYK